MMLLRFNTWLAALTLVVMTAVAGFSLARAQTTPPRPPTPAESPPQAANPIVPSPVEKPPNEPSQVPATPRSYAPETSPPSGQPNPQPHAPPADAKPKP